MVDRYATLSYVWGTDSAAYATLAAEIDAEQKDRGSKPISLPTAVSKIVKDAIYVCKGLSIPYIWVDLYCIDQVDLSKKATEIEMMGHIYRSSYVTLVAGRHNRELISTSTVALGDKQRVERIGDRTYITQQDGISFQLWKSEWIKRSWTFQEGHLARCVAFFGEADISFMCGGGHWRESLHSGAYGHDIHIPNINLASSGFHVLGGHKWLKTSEWSFKDYERMVHNYTRRHLSFESDKIAALTGCLKLIEEKKEMVFLNGLPSIDFHYALLWIGEDGPRRQGFPSWSWAGWVTSMNTTHLVGPDGNVSAKLRREEDGSFIYTHTEDMDLQLQGTLLLPGFGQSSGWNRCRQKLANIRIPPPFTTVTIETEAARFFLDIAPHGDKCEDELCAVLRTGSIEALKPDRMYRLPILSDCGIQLVDKLRNSYKITYAWLSRWPLFLALPPGELSGSELGWLMRKGLDLVRIVDVTFVEGDEKLKPFRHVVCLGVDRSEGVEGRGRRMGVYSIPGEIWEKAGPEKTVVEIW